jgi:hypothetical protein
MKKVYLLALIILFAYPCFAAVYIYSPVNAFSYASSIVPLEWHNTGTSRYCTYTLDNNTVNYGINQKQLTELTSIEIQSSSNASWNLALPSALSLNSNYLYVASTDALNRFDVSNLSNIIEDKYYDTPFYYTGYTPSRLFCNNFNCMVAWYDHNNVLGLKPDLDYDWLYGTSAPVSDTRRANYDDAFYVAPSQSRFNYWGIDPITFYAQFTGSGAPYYLGGAYGFDIEEYYESLFVVSTDADALTIIKASSSPPTGTLTLKQVILASPSIPIYSPYDVVLVGQYLYVLSAGNESVSIFNLSTDFYTASYIKTFSDSHFQESVFLKMKYYDNTLYIGTENLNTFIAYDITDRQNPTFLQNLSLPSHVITDFDAIDYMLYASDAYDDTIKIFSTNFEKNATLGALGMGQHTVNISCLNIDNSITSVSSTFNVSNIDYDGDGVTDFYDNCVFVSNPDQMDSDNLSFEMCPNGLGVGVGGNCDTGSTTDGGDACDLCPYHFDPKFQCITPPCGSTYTPTGCDTPVAIKGNFIIHQSDLDCDFTGDYCDNCPSTSNHNQLDSDYGSSLFHTYWTTFYGISEEELNSRLANPFNNTVGKYPNGYSDGGDVCDNCDYIFNPNQDNSSCTGNCSSGWFYGLINNTLQCIDANCSNGVTDVLIGETSIDYGGSCGTCVDNRRQCYNCFGVPYRELSISQSEITIDMGGRCGLCNDSIKNGEETSLNYGGHCGTCDDETLSPYIGETDIDYGGRFCGFCSEKSDRNSDAVWAIISPKIVPFDSKFCEQGQGSLMGVVIVIIVALFFILIFTIIGFGSVSALIWFFVVSIIRQIFMKKKEKGKYLNTHKPNDMK